MDPGALSYGDCFDWARNYLSGTLGLRLEPFSGDEAAKYDEAMLGECFCILNPKPPCSWCKGETI